MQAKIQQLHPVITAVESTLGFYYDFKPHSPAALHLVSQEELQKSQDFKALSPRTDAQGELLAYDAEGDLFVGLTFADHVITKLLAADPLTALRDENLNEFCVVIEEVSHFHLLINRAQMGLGVSQLEMEWQAEIDKLLVCGILLEKQYGQAHLVQLARRLYDSATIVSGNSELYWTATKYAAKFWFDAFHGRPHPDQALHSAQLRKSLVEAYTASWQGKIACIEAHVMRKAS